MTGIYFAIASLAFAIIVEEIIAHWKSVTGGLGGMSVDNPVIFGFEMDSTWHFYFICLAISIGRSYICTLNLIRSPSGRAFIAIRDSEISAESMGINLSIYKVKSFAVSGCFTGLAGALFAHRLFFLTPDAFNFLLSIQLLMMVVVGGLGTVHGAIFGAVFVGLLPQVIAIAKDYLPPSIGEFPGLEPGLFGIIMVLFIIFEPMGLYGRWLKFKRYLQLFPLYRKATFKRQKTYLKDRTCSMTFFRAENISIEFGGIRAVNNVSFDVKKGTIFTIVGPNGAGKTTIFNIISRIYNLTERPDYV